MMIDMTEWRIRDKGSEIAKRMSDPLIADDALDEGAVALARFSYWEVGAEDSDLLVAFDQFGSQTTPRDVWGSTHLVRIAPVNDDIFEVDLSIASRVSTASASHELIARVLAGIAGGDNLSKVSRELGVDRTKITELLYVLASSLNKPVQKEELERARLAWVERLERCGTDRLDTPTLSWLVDTVYDLMREQQYEELDKALDDIDVKKVSADALVTLLRFSFSARAQIPSWVSFLNRSKAELERRGINTTLELVGLFR